MRGPAVMLAALALLSPAAAKAAGSCKTMLVDTPPARRAVGPMDLLGLYDIGYMHLGAGQRLLSLSPDRRQAAFVLHRADPMAGGYCTALVLLDLGSGRARIIDRAPDLLLQPVAIRGVEVDYGLPRVILPAWSPDGKQLAWLRKVDGLAQVFAVDLRSGAAIQASRSQVGVDQFAWSADGKDLVYSDRPSRIAAQAETDAEGWQGWLLDERTLPYVGARPALRLPLPEQVHKAGDAKDAAPAPADLDLLAQARRSEAGGGMLGGDGPYPTHGWSVALVQAAPGSHASPTQLVAIDPKGRRTACAAAACHASLFFNIEGVWATDRPGAFIFLRREGWAGSQYGLYSWRPGRAPRRLLVTDDLLLGCEALGAALLCLRETSLRPRHIVRIDLARPGHIETLFDPNGAYHAFEQPLVERLRWRSRSGQEGFGDLLLPPGHRPGQRHPLVIAQYISRGFLRGGVGDELPLPLLARHGFAVLSFNKPSALFAARAEDPAGSGFMRRLHEGWADRANIHASLMAGIERVSKRGVIDDRRIGISGVSDGSTTIQYGLINAPGLFKAASIGSCCVDPTAMMIYGGRALAREREAWGYPPPMGPGSDAWQPLALGLNPPSRMAPLLMQLADQEFLIAMETIAAYQRNGRPLEVRIFPQEQHLKSSPVHRLAIYCRNLRWFSFWLDQSVQEHDCPAAADERARWQAMRGGPPATAEASGR